MKIKYVVYDHMFPVLFGEYFKHTGVKAHSDYSAGTPTSAGFVYIQEIDAPADSICSKMLKATCYGESTSLKLQSNPIDEKLIEKMLNDNL